MPATGVRRQAVCPHCGASVPLVRDRWLHVHNEGSTDYVIPRADQPRCPGSFLPIPRQSPANQTNGRVRRGPHR
jgi:hypothetical protein